MCSCGILMCLSSSPVQSVIFLILTFFCATILLFMFHVEFIGLIFIIIYVGAIAVLFLFVIMMLNIKNNQADEIKKENLFTTNIFIVFGFGLCLIIINNFYFFPFSNASFSLSSQVDSSLIAIIDKINNIEIIGQILFNNYLVCVLLAGILLLIALVGSIILTLKFNKTEKKQNANRQLARNEDFITFFK